MDAETLTPVLKFTGIAGLGFLILYLLYRPLIDLFMEKFPKVNQNMDGPRSADRV
jgi:hypothetical protein